MLNTDRSHPTFNYCKNVCLYFQGYFILKVDIFKLILGDFFDFTFYAPAMLEV